MEANCVCCFNAALSVLHGAHHAVETTKTDILPKRAILENAIVESNVLILNQLEIGKSSIDNGSVLSATAVADDQSSSNGFDAGRIKIKFDLDVSEKLESIDATCASQPSNKTKFINKK